ncbi:glyoxalase [Rhodoplanes elegans]|uniref:Glyoxalase n=1 Tax=Rhodoplanes elegans TaxID=29408 RepID=A0A327KPI7_9BRAD|nr:VOC family protein [Rhodoplanes elegans]MBK5961668.1 glyoxalase [Rhodoplanes elegans]RAI40327.1 glyoxalase [Rhodoplanes elegans]
MHTGTWRCGRLIDHLQLVVSDIEASRRFYGAVFAALGIRIGEEGANFFYADELYVSGVTADSPPTGRIHLAFQTPDQATVDRFYAAALSAGGRDNGPPGPRDYHPGYYAAFVLDPDGNNIEAVFHGATTRSADAVVITAVD